MSEELKKKLLNYEVSPPGIVWDKIADALDEEITAGFPRQLYEAEVMPPSGTWSNIASALENVKDEFPAKLYDLEVNPPADAWPQISEALDEENRVPQIPTKRKIIPIVRYAIAASIIAAVALGTFKLLNQKTAERGVANKTVLPKNTTPNIIQPQRQDNSALQPLPSESNNLPKERVIVAKTNSELKRRLPQAGYMTQTVNPAAISVSSLAATFQKASLSGEVPGNCSLISDADRYLMFINPDGYLIRISKKLAETLGCIYTNRNSEEFNQCQEQIKKWRDKIAQSPASSSPDNFMDILDIIKSVQDKEL
ncbi:MAG: hypothetical protein E6H06_07635 [Bacteroidetes bacterium]|nr:MAG: hypothetical protein E6H06_07635 [Bacteroidota bacterium]